jgi:adenine-specific DNA-methyltransferase
LATGEPLRSKSEDRAASPFDLSYGFKASAEAIIGGTRASLRPVFDTNSISPNRLIYGDNLHVLRSLLDDSEVAGKVQLIYIDPPYSTHARFVSPDDSTAYVDDLGGAAYLEFMRERLILLRELLTMDGSIYVHLDSNMVFPVKVIMDEVFGAKHFRNMITRVKCNPKNFTSRQFGDVCDYILFYGRSVDPCWNEPFTPWDEASATEQYQYVEEESGRRYKKVPVHAPGKRNGATGGLWRDRLPPPGKHWVLTPERLDELDRQGRIYWSPNGNPRRKIYLDESQGIRVSNVWTRFRDTQNQNARITGYPTEKNLEMMELIVATSSNPDAIVLDAFCGSGTTLAAADVLGRRWIGIDSSAEAIVTTVERMALGTPRMGSYARKTHLRNGDGDLSHISTSALNMMLDETFDGDPLPITRLRDLLLDNQASTAAPTTPGSADRRAS